MLDSPNIYKMSDIRKCFSTVGDTTLSKWLDKGLIAHQSDKKGIRSNIRYTALEIVHVGVLTLLSTWGVLTYYKDAEVAGGYVSPETFAFFTPAELAALPPSSGYHEVWELSLTKPERIVEYYCAYGPDLKMTITSCQVPVEQQDRRMRRTKTVFDIKILPPHQALEWERDRFGMRPEIEELFVIDAPIVITHKYGAEAYMEFGFLKLDIDMIIRHVYSKLDLLVLLD
ncbi:MAG: hypothetical protein M0T73_17115 [Deltaproteobacteria bacterium]|nr:hypothetical protein [Deltaproteobacteria bacterium]